jgi:hypothetical protein
MGAAGAPARMAPTRTPQLGSQDPRRSGWTGRWRWVLRCCPDQLAGPPLGRPPSTRWRRVTAQRRRAELTRFPGPNSFRACLPRLADDLLRACRRRFIEVLRPVGAIGSSYQASNLKGQVNWSAPA